MNDYALSEGVKKEIRLWSKTALEVPEENLNNLPMCPFAKKHGILGE